MVVLIEDVRSDRAEKGQADYHIPSCTLHVSFLSFHLATESSFELALMILAEMARCFGGGFKAGALSMHFTRNIKPNVQLVQDALARGADPIGITMLENVRNDKPGKRWEILTSPTNILHVPFLFWLMCRRWHF